MCIISTGFSFRLDTLCLKLILVIYVSDKESPTIECPANQTRNTDYGKSTAFIEWQDPLASDNSGDRPTVVCHPPSRTSFAIGSTRVNCIARDGYGNKNKCYFYVNITGKILYVS